MFLTTTGVNKFIRYTEYSVTQRFVILGFQSILNLQKNQMLLKNLWNLTVYVLGPSLGDCS